ncbi:hypothetical protein GmRootV512_62630 [Variovorax sp. V512]
MPLAFCRPLPMGIRSMRMIGVAATDAVATQQAASQRGTVLVFMVMDSRADLIARRPVPKPPRRPVQPAGGA